MVADSPYSAVTVAEVVRIVRYILAVSIPYIEDDFIETVGGVEQRQIEVNVRDGTQLLFVVRDVLPIVGGHGHQHEDASEGTAQYGQRQGDKERRLGHAGRPPVGLQAPLPARRHYRQYSPRLCGHIFAAAPGKWNDAGGPPVIM